MRLRPWLAAPCVLLVLGCAATRLNTVSPNPLVIPTADFELVWNQTIAVVDEYFDIASENRLARKIVTQPVEGATVLEPWRKDSVGFQERLESSLQTIRRFAIVTVVDAPGGGYAVKVEVYKELEDLTKPDRKMGGRDVLNNAFPVNRVRDAIGPIPVSNGWILRGRDHKLEQAILAKLRHALFL